jgi:predicted site-specific integrase-resolvase
MKLSTYAKKVGISYNTAYRWYKSGQIKGYQADTGTIIVAEKETASKPVKVAVYARVSSSENKSNLDSQADRLTAYCAAKGYQVARVIKEIGSGVNDSRPKLIELLQDESVTLVIVEHKDRLTRFGFNYIETLLEKQGRKVEVINLADNGKEDLMQDLVSIIYSFSARMYGQRRAKRKTEKIVKELQDQNDATG